MRHRTTRHIIIQKARGQALPKGHSPPTACRHTVSGTLSPPSSGYFSPFPHGTCSLSVAGKYLGLDDGPPRFPPGFTCPVVLRNSLRCFRFRLRDFHPLWSSIPERFGYLIADRVMEALQPLNTKVMRFGLVSVRSPLLGESQLMSFPSGTEMFHFPEFALHAYLFSVQ